MANLSQEAQDELLLLESMYPDRFHWIHHPATTDLLSLDPVFNDGLEHHVEMSVTIGADYPGRTKPRITLSISEMGREDLERFRGEYGARLSAHDEEGSVCLDVGLATLLELAGQFSITPTGPHNPNPPSSSSSSPIQPFHNPPPDGKVSMAWSVFWMHHIKATGKRKQIVGWARELQIRGWSKPGYPGALVIDGPKASVEEYSNRLKALRWKAIQQRHFEVYHIPLLDPAQDQQQQELSERHRRIRLAPTGPLPPVDEVIEVQSMAQLLQHASHSSGLQDLLLQILKIK